MKSPQQIAADRFPYMEQSENTGEGSMLFNERQEMKREAFIAGMQEREKEIEKKQKQIDLCRMALEEIVNKETDPVTAAGGALLFLNHREPTEGTKEWAKKVIEKHKQHK